MAQSGFTPIQLYSSPTPGNTPAASNLTNGELAINVADGKLFFKNTAGNTQVLADSTWAAYSSGVGLQGSGTSVVNTGTVQFANSNGVTFGLTGSTMTASVNSGPSIQGSGTNIASSGTVQFANSNGVTFGLNGNTMTATVAPTPITVSAGTTSAALNNVVFASSNGISFGLTSNTVTAQPYLSSIDVADQIGPYKANATIGALPGPLFVAPFIVSAPIIASVIDQPVSIRGGGANVSITLAYTGTDNNAWSSATQARSVTQGFTGSLVNGLYTKNGDTLSQITSASLGVSQTLALTFSATTVNNSLSNTGSYTLSITASYPTGVSGSSFVYGSSTSSTTTTALARAFSSIVTSISSRTVIIPVPAVMSLGIANYALSLYSTPTLLPANTYWLIQRVDNLTAATNPGAMPNIVFEPQAYAQSATLQFVRNEGLYVGVGGAVPAYGDYKGFFGYNSNGSVYTYTGFDNYNLAYPGVSVASTAYSNTYNTTAGGTQYFPQATIR